MQVMANRMARAEQLLSLQRQRVMELEERGLGTGTSLRTLKLMEATMENFYTTWKLFLHSGSQSPGPIVGHPRFLGSTGDGAGDGIGR